MTNNPQDPVPTTQDKEPNSYKIEKLWSKHQEVLRRLSLGQRNKDIAMDLNMNKNTVSQIKNSDLGQKFLRELNAGSNAKTKDVKERIREIAPEALNVLEGIVTGDPEALGGQSPSLKQRYKASKDILEKAGHVAPSKVDKSVEHKLTGSDVDKIKRRSEEADVVITDEGE